MKKSALKEILTRGSQSTANYSAGSEKESKGAQRDLLITDLDMNKQKSSLKENVYVSFS